MDTGTVLHGFRLVRQEQVAEIDAQALVFVHEKTRAEVVGLRNADDNKTFCLTFRTLPADDTGVPHILEHSVLNGSRKYPVKEPFVELLKSSLCTFLNAFTYPDRTVYPVSSRNQQDFHNLMDVYLDAVFHPRLTRQTFMQEGWHAELAAPAAELEFSGVVYNEMLGASSSPEAVLSEQLERALFPASVYGRNSGGDPERIPDLTYEQFTAFHRQFYHPSNSRTVLYGDFDVAARLAHLDEYFGVYEHQPPLGRVTPQPRFGRPATVVAPYPVTPGVDLANKTYVLRGWLLDRTADPERHLAVAILARLLSGSPAAPLYKALIESRLGNDVVGWFETDILEAFGCVGLKGTNAAKQAAVEQVIDDTLRRLAAGGLDARTIEAAVNATEFRLREANYGGYSKGLIYALQMAASWLYDGEPLALLKYEAPLAAIKRQAGQGYFQNLIRRYLLDNPHRVTICLRPDPEFENRRLARLKQRLAERQAQLTPAALDQVVTACRELRAAQLRPDPPEVVATIPKLPLSCIPKQAEVLPLETVSAAPALWFSGSRPAASAT